MSPSDFEQADARLSVLAQGLTNDPDGFTALMARIACEADPSALTGVLVVHGAVSKISAANPHPIGGEGRASK